MVAESVLISNNCTRMPRNRFTKTNRKPKEEHLYSEVDEVNTRPATIPTPKLSTVNSDYRNGNTEVIKLSPVNSDYQNETTEAEFNQAVRRSHTLGGYLDTKKLFNSLARSKSERRHQEATETDSSQDTFKTPQPPRMRRLPTRHYTQCRFTPRPTPPPRNQSRPSQQPSQKYRETYIFSVNTQEPTTLIGDNTRRVYAKIPEYSTIRADSHIRGPPGQVTYQESTATQTANPWLSSFQRSFANLNL